MVMGKKHLLCIIQNQAGISVWSNDGLALPLIVKGPLVADRLYVLKVLPLNLHQLKPIERTFAFLVKKTAVVAFSQSSPLGHFDMWEIFLPDFPEKKLAREISFL